MATDHADVAVPFLQAFHLFLVLASEQEGARCVVDRCDFCYMHRVIIQRRLEIELSYNK